MSVFSKISKEILLNKYLRLLLKTNAGKSSIILLAVISVLIIYKKNARETQKLNKIIKSKSTITKENNYNKHKGKVDFEFLKKNFQLLKTAIPSIKSVEFGEFILLNISLILRTVLSIYISSINGMVVKAIINVDLSDFIKKLGLLISFAFPSSFINSLLEYLQKDIAIRMRKNLTLHYNKQYVKDSLFYKMLVVDNRIDNPDQILTEDIKLWCNSISSVYVDFFKPILDIFLFSKKLSQIMGYKGPISLIFFYIFYGALLKIVMPPFGKMIAFTQQIEGEFRSMHSKLLIHSESIGFLRGFLFEKEKMYEIFKKLMNHNYYVADKKFYIEIFDSLLLKYGAFMVSYSILGLPVFGKNKENYLAKIGNDSSNVMRDYVRNSSLLINLSKAVGKVIISYKNMQNLAGYTGRVYLINNVLNDLNNNLYKRVITNMELKDKLLTEKNLVKFNIGKVKSCDYIRFEDVPIITPNGDVLVEKLSFNVNKSTNLLITGANGLGKTSIIRILHGLWPLFDGIVSKPSKDEILILPQRAYLPSGNIKELIEFPYLNKKITDEELKEIMKKLKIDYLLDRETELKSKNDWYDVLSGGEKQRIGVARFLFHKPKYVIIDDSTSAVSADIEKDLYLFAKDHGITLITISQRSNLDAFHDLKLKFNDSGEWTLEKIFN